MGIIRTDEWLKTDFDHPITICEKLLPYFKGQSAKNIYNQLMNFGMYRPSWSSKKNYQQMVKYRAWEKVDRLFQKYKAKWSGPDIPIFIFPLQASGSFLFRQDDRNKSGVSFPDKMFLFLSDYEDIKEIEALFVHEYHHVCRLRGINKKLGEYTLLDSIIIEGLAEYAVLKNCGEEYLAKWCQMYSEREIEIFWERFLDKQLTIRKNERDHDALLYGGGRVPPLLGYAAGYTIIEKYYNKNNYSTKLSFTTPATVYYK